MGQRNNKQNVIFGKTVGNYRRKKGFNSAETKIQNRAVHSRKTIPENWLKTLLYMIFIIFICLNKFYLYVCT